MISAYISENVQIFLDEQHPNHWIEWKELVTSEITGFQSS